MSHQVNFYLDPVDTDALEARLRDGEDLRVLHSRSTSTTPRVVPSVRADGEGAPRLPLYFVRAVELHQVVMRHEPGVGQWSVDALRSPVLELRRSFYDGSVLGRGRLFFSEGFRDDGEKWVEKPRAFQAWASAAIKKAKKMMLRHDADYIGPHAQSWLEQWHGQLVD